MGRAGDRPEHTAPPDVFYDDTEARKYTTNSRIMQIQTQLTERALELLALPEDGQPKLLLGRALLAHASSVHVPLHSLVHASAAGTASYTACRLLIPSPW